MIFTRKCAKSSDEASLQTRGIVSKFNKMLHAMAMCENQPLNVEQVQITDLSDEDIMIKYCGLWSTRTFTNSYFFIGQLILFFISYFGQLVLFLWSTLTCGKNTYDMLCYFIMALLVLVGVRKSADQDLQKTVFCRAWKAIRVIGSL